MNDNVPKLKARQILRDLKVESPDLLQYLKEICVERGAYVREDSLNDSEGRLVVSGKKGIITVNPSDTYLGRTRFSIGHELGHFEMHRNLREASSSASAVWNCTTADMNDWSVRANYENRELEANEFAAELLMPLKLVRPDLDRDQPSLSALKELATRYNVSLSAIAYRFIELTREACAVVFVRQGKVSYSWRSRLFDTQRYRIPTGKLVGEKSIAFQAARGLKTPPRMTAVSAREWLVDASASRRDEGAARRGAGAPLIAEPLESNPVLEQSEYFRKVDFGITLLWIQGGGLIRY